MLGQYFTFNGVHSDTFNARMLRFDGGGFISESVIGGASIEEEQISNDFKPSFRKLTRQPIEFTKEIVLVDRYDNALEWTEADRQTVFNWLFHDEYKPLIFEDRPDIVYYVIATGDLSLNTINGKGYLSVTFRSNSPFPWRAERKIEIPASPTGSSELVLYIEKGLAVSRLYPLIELERVGTSSTTVQVGNQVPITAGNQVIEDLSNSIGLQASKINDVTKIRMNTKHKSITNALTGESLYRFKTEQSNFPFLIEGGNTISISQGWKATIYLNEPVKY